MSRGSDPSAHVPVSLDRDGTEKNPLIVMLVPSETGSTSVLDDYEPLFKAVEELSGLHFDLKMGDSYNAVVEGMVAGHVDLAFFGAVTFDEAKKRGAAELLAVEETDGESVYYSGWFCRKDAGLQNVKDLEGKSIAVGDPKSTSSFNYPMAILMAEGVDPIRDIDKILMAGSHSASLEALKAGHVDAAAASLNAFNKMVENGTVNPNEVVLLSKSDPIPSPPLAMHVSLPDEIKTSIRAAFATVHEAEGVSKEIILGYGGKPVDRYNTEFDPAVFDRAMAKLAAVTPELKDEIITKAGER